MATRVVEWKKPYTWWKAISIDENKVISLNLRDENNLIIYDEWDDEIYVDLQLDDEITPTDAFPIWVNVGRAIVDNWWDLAWTIISAVTTSGDNIKILYADDWTLWIDNGTGTFKQIYFKADVDALLLALRNYIDWELAKKQNWVSSDTAPSSPSEWDLWYDTTNSAMKVWDWTAWQSVGWWDVLVSDQANNIFTPWMKIWGGTESDYQSLTPDSNTAYLLLAGWPTPRQPWVNTVLYVPMDTDLLDHWPNNISLTNTNVTIGTVGWVDAWLFPAIDAYYNLLADLSSYISSWDYTVLVWVNALELPTWSNPTPFTSIRWGFATSPYRWASMILSTGWFVIGVEWWQVQSSIIPTLNTWCLICWVYKTNEGILYINWSQEASNSRTSSYGFQGFGIWQDRYDDAGRRRHRRWYMSNFIIENKAWTSQEIQDYYDQTKANYWIS